MDPVSLTARIGYALVAVPLGSALGFYPSILLLPKLGKLLQQGDPRADGFSVFVSAILAGGVLAFTASAVALTLPWIRRRKHRGRTGRMVLSCVFVLLASLGFADQGHALLLDLAFTLWLAYTVTFTFVRYGVLDQARRTRASVAASSSIDADA